MRILMALGLLLALAVGIAKSGGEKGKDKHADEHVVVKPGDLKWGPAPAGLPAGAQVAIVLGDPGKAGMPFVLRAKLPDGYTVAPHWHPSDENVTVLKGTFLVGRGTKLDAEHADVMPAGSFLRMPKEMRHFAKAKGEVILQIHGIGPFDIHYVNADDDPRKKK